MLIIVVIVAKPCSLVTFSSFCSQKHLTELLSPLLELFSLLGCQGAQASKFFCSVQPFLRSFFSCIIDQCMAKHFSVVCCFFIYTASKIESLEGFWLVFWRRLPFRSNTAKPNSFEDLSFLLCDWFYFMILHGLQMTRKYKVSPLSFSLLFDVFY